MKPKLLIIAAVLLLTAGAGAGNNAEAAPVNAPMLARSAAPVWLCSPRRAGLAGRFRVLAWAANAAGLRNLARVGKGLGRGPEQGRGLGKGRAAGPSAFQVRVWARRGFADRLAAIGQLLQTLCGYRTALTDAPGGRPVISTSLYSRAAESNRRIVSATRRKARITQDAGRKEIERMGLHSIMK